MPMGAFLGVLVVVTSLVMGWLTRARDEERRPGQPRNVLKQPRAVLIIGAVEVGFFTAMALLALIAPGEESSPELALGMLFFTLLGWPLVGEYYRAWHELTPDGMRYRPLLRAPGTLRWRDVSRVRYSLLWKWFVIEGRGGEVVRVSALLQGLPEFARRLLEGAPPASIDAKARPLIEQTAAGRPPSIWG